MERGVRDEEERRGRDRGDRGDSTERGIEEREGNRGEREGNRGERWEGIDGYIRGGETREGWTEKLGRD